MEKHNLDEELDFQSKRASKIDVVPESEEVFDRYKYHKLWRFFPREFLFKRIGLLKGEEILDFGCGEGVLSVLFAKLGGRVTGLDISPDLIELAKRRAEIHNLQEVSDFVVGDIFKNPLGERKFDFIVCNCVLHHVDLEKVVPILLQHLKAEGKMIILEPSAFSPLLQKFRDILPLEKDISPGERQLNRNDLRFIKTQLANFEIRYFDFLGRLSRLFPNQNKIDVGHHFTKAAIVVLHSIDRMLISVFPFLSKFYGFFVIVGKKKSG